MTADEIAQLRALMAKATPGPWGGHTNVGPKLRSYSQSACVAGEGEHLCKLICGCFEDIGGEDVAYANANLIAGAVSALPALLSLAEDAARMREALSDVAGGSNIDGASNMVLAGDWKGFSTALQSKARAALAPPEGT